MLPTYLPTYLPRYLYGRYMPFAKSWSSLDKEESLASKITSPFNNNRFFLKNKIALQKQPIFLLNGEVIWQATDSSWSDLHGLMQPFVWAVNRRNLQLILAVHWTNFVMPILALPTLESCYVSHRKYSIIFQNCEQSYIR